LKIKEVNTMKTLIPFFVFSLCVFLNLRIAGQTNTELLVSEGDTTLGDEPEYELIVMSPGYETFLATQLPMEYYSESYYKLWNHQYVVEWNIRYHSGPRRDLYENEIQYDHFTDYGIELEYRLYHFFRFFEDKHNLTLVHRAR
jgi:hypothetical protein